MLGEFGLSRRARLKAKDTGRPIVDPNLDWVMVHGSEGTQSVYVSAYVRLRACVLACVFVCAHYTRHKDLCSSYIWTLPTRAPVFLFKNSTVCVWNCVCMCVCACGPVCVCMYLCVCTCFVRRDQRLISDVFPSCCPLCFMRWALLLV